MTPYRPRALGRLVRAALAEMPVVVVTGLRQSGRSTFLQHEKSLAGLRAFLDKTPRCRAAFLAYGGTEILRLGDRLWAVPLAAVLE